MYSILLAFCLRTRLYFFRSNICVKAPDAFCLLVCLFLLFFYVPGEELLLANISAHLNKLRYTFAFKL